MLILSSGLLLVLLYVCLSLILGFMLMELKLIVSRLEISLILVLRPVWSPVELFLREVPWVVAVLSEPDFICIII